MYDPNSTYKKFDVCYNTVDSYISKSVSDNSHNNEIYRLKLAIESMREAMLETENELLKRMVEEKELK